MKIKYLSLSLSILLLSGCATLQNYQVENSHAWNQAQQKNKPGHYQAALDDLHKLDKQYPKNEMIQLHITNIEFSLAQENAWLKKLELAQPLAKNDGLFAKSMVLSGTLNQYRANLAQQQNYQVLKDQIFYQHQFQLEAVSLDDNIKSNSLPINPAWQIDNSTNNPANTWYFNKVQGKFSTRQEIELIKQTYIAEVNEEINPKFKQLELDIVSQNLDKDVLYRDFDLMALDIKEINLTVKKLELQLSRLPLDPTPTALPTQPLVTNTVTSAPTAINEKSPKKVILGSKIEKAIDTPRQTLQKVIFAWKGKLIEREKEKLAVEKKIVQLDGKIYDNKQALNKMPPFVDVNIYEDHYYDKIKTTKTATFTVKLVNEHGTFEAPVVLTKSGFSWQPQDIIALEGHTFRVPSHYDLSQEVKPQLQAAANELFKQVMNKQFDNEFKQLINTVSWQQKFEFWVAQVLITKSLGINPYQDNEKDNAAIYQNLLIEIENQLQAEFGKAHGFKLKEIL